MLNDIVSHFKLRQQQGRGAPASVTRIGSAHPADDADMDLPRVSAGGRYDLY